MENYAAAKFRILRNQTGDDWFIYWKDDPVIKQQLEQVQTEAMQLPFSELQEDGNAAYVDDGIVRFVTPREVWDIPRDRLALPGLHNLYNSMAAGLSASILNIRKEDIRHALENFEAVEHRLEYVDTIAGVRYVNDSKATNVNSTWYALESMTGPTVLILGGKDKGNDYTEIEPLVRDKVKAVVCMGKDNAKLMDFFQGKCLKSAIPIQYQKPWRPAPCSPPTATPSCCRPAAPASTSSQVTRTAAVSSSSR